MKIIALRKHVIFQFIEDISGGKRFVNSTKSGIIISAKDVNQSNLPRWGKVTHLGPEVDPEDVKVGDFVLIEPGKWTVGFMVDGARYWKTDEEQLMAVSDKPYTTY